MPDRESIGVWLTGMPPDMVVSGSDSVQSGSEHASICSCIPLGPAGDCQFSIVSITLVAPGGLMSHAHSVGF
eukprot:3933744-Rhodomonas_salina.3